MSSNSLCRVIRINFCQTLAVVFAMVVVATPVVAQSEAASPNEEDPCKYFCNVMPGNFTAEALEAMSVSELLEVGRQVYPSIQAVAIIKLGTLTKGATKRDIAYDVNTSNQYASYDPVLIVSGLGYLCGSPSDDSNAAKAAAEAKAKQRLQRLDDCLDQLRKVMDLLKKELNKRASDSGSGDSREAIIASRNQVQFWQRHSNRLRDAENELNKRDRDLEKLGNHFAELDEALAKGVDEVLKLLKARNGESNDRQPTPDR